MRKWIFGTVIFLIVGCSSHKNKTADFEVEYQGALREIMHKGDLSARIFLSELESRPYLYALGSAENLKGEIQIFEGKAWNTSVVNGEIVFDHSFSAGASLLVYAQVEKWREFSIPDSVDSAAAFEVYLEEKARAEGLNTDLPFPFLIKGNPRSVHWHIIDWKEGDMEHSHEKHKNSGKNGQLENTPMEILGFFSRKHQTVFTHHSTYIHLHFKTLDNSLAGHIDEFVPGENMVLRLPGSL